MTDVSAFDHEPSDGDIGPASSSWSAAPTVRTAGFVVLALAAAAAMIFLRPTSVDPGGDYRMDIADALKAAEASETEEVDRALLLVSARQENELLLAASSQQTADTRLAVLVLLTVLAICWHGLTLPRPTFTN
jgi:hypothetical protein